MKKEICLSNLNEFSKQEIFNKVATHLLTQNQRSTKGDEVNFKFCMYKNPNGLKCAVGCLISDSEYSLSMDENMNTMFIESNSQFNKFNIKSELYDFLRELQELHDEIEPKDWELELKLFAINKGLEFTT